MGCSQLVSKTSVYFLEIEELLPVVILTYRAITFWTNLAQAVTSNQQYKKYKTLGLLFVWLVHDHVEVAALT